MRKMLLFVILVFAVSAVMGFPRVPVAEIISETWCVPCGALHSYIDDNYPAIYDDAVLLDYITDALGTDEIDPFCYYIYWLYNPDEDGYSIPSGGVDGVWGFVGATFAPDIIDTLIARAGTETPVGLWFEDVTSDTAYIAVTIDDASAAGDYRLFVFILESGITIPGTAIDEYNWTVRDMLTGTTGEPFTIAYGETLHFAIPYEFGDDWQILNCELAAYVDDDSIHHTIFQGAHGEIPPPDYYYVLHTDATSLIGEPGDELVSYVLVENNGMNGDTIDIHLESDAPATWVINACTPEVCFLVDASMYVEAGAIETVSVHFYTDSLEEGSGTATLTFTSRATSRTYDVDFSASTGGDIFIVDDDQGDDYEHYFTDALDELGMNYTVFDRLEGVPTAENMAIFDMVIWFCGTPWIDVLNDDDIDVLSTYLDGGGKLFITSAEIGYDLVLDGTPNEEFYNNYLHADCIADDADIYDIYGVTGDPITDGFSLLIAGGDGADNQLFPDVIDTLGGSVPILYYGTGTDTCAGLRFEGTYRLVYLSFGFEAINTPNDRRDLLENIVNWLLEVGIDEKLVAPKKLSLSVSPNPFNGACAITAPADARIEIFDLSGKLVYDSPSVHSDNVQPDGLRTLIWRPQQSITSGIYMARATAGQKSVSKKFVYLK